MAPINRLLAVSGSKPTGTRLRPIGTGAPTTGRLTPKLVIKRSPLKSIQTASRQPEKEDKGFLRGLSELFTDVPEVVKGAAFGVLPFIKDATETAIKINRLRSGFGAPIIRQAARDYRTAREEGATGQQLFEATFARDLPMVGQMGTSFYRTGTRGLETGILGLPLRAAGVDLGEQGVDYKNALRRGELLGTLVEDVGNVMLTGRLMGLGSLAARGGRALSEAGKPKLGRIVSTFGAFAEEPIATSLRGAAQLTGAVARSRANAGSTGRLAGRIAAGAERVGTSTTPIRTIGQGLLGGYRNLAENQRIGFVNKQNVLRDRIENALSLGLEPSQKDIDALAEARRGEELWRTRTEPFKGVRRMTAQMMGEGEALERTPSQTLFRFAEKGPVPESRKNLTNAYRKVMQRARDLARSDKLDDQAKAAETLEYAEHLERKINAKDRYDKTGEMVQPEYINDTFGAAVILASGQGSIIRREIANGRSIPDIISSMIPKELTDFAGRQGYLITKGAVERALAYMDLPPGYDLLNRVGVEEALYILRSNSEFMTGMRQRGEGMVRGAASPFETGIYPLPEFVVKELKSASNKTKLELYTIFDNLVAQIIQRDFPNLVEELQLDLDDPKGIFKKFADARKDSAEYAVSYQAIVESFPMLRQIPEFQNFLLNPMIYPSNMRISVQDESSFVKRAASEDLQQLAVRLVSFSQAFPDVVSSKTLADIENAVKAAADPYAKYDPKNWSKVQSLVNKVIKSAETQRAKIVKDRGTLAARTDERWVRLEELAAVAQSAYGMIQTIIDRPELFADQAQVAEAGRLRGVAEEASAERQAMGEVSSLPTINTYEQRLSVASRQAERQKKRNNAKNELDSIASELVPLTIRRNKSRDIGPEELRAIEDELALAYEITDRYTYDVDVTTEQAKQTKQEQIQDLRAEIGALELPFRGVGKFRRADLTKAGPRFVNKLSYKNVSEDLNKDIDNASVNRPEVRKEFIRRFTEQKEKESSIAWDSWLAGYASNVGLENITEGMSSAVEAFGRLLDAEKRLKEITRTSVENIRQRLIEEQKEQLASDLDRAYAEAQVRDPRSLEQILEDVENPEQVSGPIADLRAREEELRREIDEMNRLINLDETEIQRLVKVEQESIPRARVEEAKRLRGVEQQVTEQASLLESAALKGQQETVKARLKGVGRVVQEWPEKGQIISNEAYEQLIEQQRDAGFNKENFGDLAPSLYEYVNDGAYFVNRFLRSGFSQFDADQYGATSYMDDIPKFIRDLDTLFENAPEVQTPIRIYRGVSTKMNVKKLGLVGDKPFIQNLYDLKPGDTFTDPAYISTSNRRDIARTFASGDGKLIEIIIPPGQKVIAPGHMELPGAYAMFEGELLLPRNTTFRVVANYAGYITLVAEPKKQAVLQRQFERPLLAEQDRLLKRQQKDWEKTQQLRIEQAAKEEALAEAQTIPESGGRREAQLAQPRLTDIGGEAPIYMPAGVSQIINPAAAVKKQPFGTGVAPENVASFEQKRTGTTLARTPGQAGARIKEILRALNRNRIIQSIIENKQYVSTIAERVTAERREQLMQQATQNIESRERATPTKPIQDVIQEEYKILLMKELERMGLEPISPVEMPDPNDPFAEREALKALDERVSPEDLTETTLVMTRGMRQGLANQFINQDSARGPEFIRNLADRIGRGTGSWKSVVLPFSVRWQVGDAVGNVLNAWVRAGIPPDELFEVMFYGQGLRINEDGTFYYESPSVLERMRTEPEIVREQGRLGRILRRPAPQPGQAPLRQTLFGERVEEYMSDPVMAAQQSAGLQTSGNKLEDLRAQRGGTLLPGPESRVGKAFFPRFRQAAFSFNEAQNTMARSAVAMIELKKILDERGRNIDEISPVDAFNDPELYEANRLAVERANEALGNFSALSPYERQVVRKIYPFWSWIRFINKAAFQLLVDQPDRVLFMAHLGAMSMEDEVDGLWDWLQGKEEIPGLGFVDLNFLNPYQDAIAFSGKPWQRLLETATSLSPIIEFPAAALGELYYGGTGRRLPFTPSLSRPGYLEGRPEESTRTLADTLGGIAYRGLRTFGGPYRNIIDVLPQEPSRITGPGYGLLVTPEGRIRGTDVAVGPVERFSQGSPRTEGAYAVPRLSPTAGRLSAVGRTFGIPTPLVSSDVARRMAADNAERSRRALLRRINERRLANR